MQDLLKGGGGGGALRIISGRRFSKGGRVPLPARSAEAFDEI